MSAFLRTQSGITLMLSITYRSVTVRSINLLESEATQVPPSFFRTKTLFESQSDTEGFDVLDLVSFCISCFSASSYFCEPRRTGLHAAFISCFRVTTCFSFSVFSSPLNIFQRPQCTVWAVFLAFAALAETQRALSREQRRRRCYHEMLFASVPLCPLS